MTVLKKWRRCNLKKFIYLFISVILFLIPTIVKADDSNTVTLYLFHSKSCLHCQDERKFLDEIKDKYPNLVIKEYEISNSDNAELMSKVKEIFNNNSPYVPYTTIGTKDFVGFSDITADLIEQAIIEYSNKNYCDKTGVYLGKADDQYCTNEEKDSINSIKIPLLGRVNPKDVSLPLITIILGTIDGFNPCAMWILLFLITMLINMKNRKRMWALGVAFLVTSALVYLLFMVAWLKITVQFTSIMWVSLIIALVALVGGSINLRSYFKAKETGCEVVNDTRRKKIITQIKKFTSEKSFILALLGIIVLAATVNLVELSCSAGLPIVFTQILALNNLPGWQYWLYILLYILFFLIDDLIVFTIAMTTLKITGISNKYTKYSHLIGGIIMVLIGILLVLKPEWLMFNFK